MASEFEFHHENLAVYTPQANSVETTNKTIKQILRVFVNERQTNWHYFIPKLMFAINSCDQSLLDNSKKILMFGREISLTDVEGGNHVPVVYDYSDALQEQKVLQEIH